jgi:hypothetical protein
MAAALSAALSSSGPHLLDSQELHLERLLDIQEHNPQMMDLSATGSGKTYTTLALAKKLGLTLLVFCPKVMVEKWRNLADEFELNLVDAVSYQMLAGKNGVYNHPYLETDPVTGELRVTKYLSEIFRSLPTLVVVDECQYCKNDSIGTKSVSKITSSAIDANKKNRVIILSATPFDKESCADNVMKILGIVRGTSYFYDRSTKEFSLTGGQVLWDMCKSIYPDNLDYFTEPVSRTTYHQFSHQVMTHVVAPIISSKMDPPELDFPHDLANGFFEPASQEDAELIKELKYALKKRLREGEEESFSRKDWGEFIRVCRGLEAAKIGMVVREARKVLEENPTHKVILAAHYITNILALYEGMEDYAPGLMYGEIPIKERASTLAKFQEPNTEMRVLVVNPSVCGVGVDMDDKDGGYPRHLFIIPCYELIKVVQMVGRVYRMSTKSQPHTRVVYANEFEDENHVMECLEKKGFLIKDVTRSEEVGLCPGMYPPVRES